MSRSAGRVPEGSKEVSEDRLRGEGAKVQDVATLFLQAARAELERRYKRMRSLVTLVDDSQLNWRPNLACNSMANLTAHLAGNLGERYLATIGGEVFQRNRDAEFDVRLRLTRDQALSLLDERFPAALRVLEQLDPKRLTELAPLPAGQAPLVDYILQTLVHYGEHVGQAIYLVKAQLGSQLNLPT